MTRIVSLAIAALFGASATIISAQEVAVATNFGATNEANCGYFSQSTNPVWNCVSMANNSTHTVAYNSLGGEWPGISGATTWAIDNALNPLDLTAYYTTTDPYPDVEVFDGYWPNLDRFAWVDCPWTRTGLGTTPNGRWCRGQYLRYNGSLRATFEYRDPYVSGERALAMHELAHTLGLRHVDSNGGTSDSVMLIDNDGSQGGGVFATKYYSTHDKAHLNAAY